MTDGRDGFGRACGGQFGGCGIGVGFGWGFFLVGMGCPVLRRNDMFGIPKRLFERRLQPSVIDKYKVASGFEDDDDGDAVDKELEKDEFINSVIVSIQNRRERLKQLRERVRRDSKR